MTRVKLFAMYLPQFHCIPENDEFWGKGFTDWVTVRRASSLYKKHIQPKVPYNDNYYDLSKEEDIAWQVKIANDYGIDGWGIYHYWFNDEKCLLLKPAESILNNADLKINFFFAWDNTTWKRSWSNVKEGNSWAPSMEQNVEHKGTGVLIPYVLGSEKEWEKHFKFLLPYFTDERYEKKEGKPLFVIFHYSEKIAEMCRYWDKLAKKVGFDGMFFIFRYDSKERYPASMNVFKYEPIYSGWSHFSFMERVTNKMIKILRGNKGPDRYRYSSIWKSILGNAKTDNRINIYHGAFVSYDDTPRRGRKGIVVEGVSSTLFKRYLSNIIKISKEQNKDYIFLTAWNEWGEGAYLEPDAINKYTYLQAIKDI